MSKTLHHSRTPITVIFSFLAALVESAPMPSPETVTLSGAGVSDHGLPNLVCFPAKWTDVALFFIVNYFAHAVTSRPDHGDSTFSKVLGLFTPLIMPMAHVGNALYYISHWCWKFTVRFPFIEFPEDTLATAQKAGALIMAIRTNDWVPDPDVDEVFRNAIIDSATNLNMESSSFDDVVIAGNVDRGDFKRLLVLGGNSKRSTDGSFQLPSGYAWAFVPCNAAIRPLGNLEAGRDEQDEEEDGGDSESLSMRLGASFSIVHPTAAVVQAVSAGITLYKARGDQINRYGFTAFGLTVIPYLLMSIVNFFAQIAIPCYDKLHIIRSEVLDEAVARLGRSRSPRRAVGELIPSIAPGPDYVDIAVRKGSDAEATRYVILPQYKEGDTPVAATEAMAEVSFNSEEHPEDGKAKIIIPQWPIVQTNPALSVTQVRLISWARYQKNESIFAVILWLISLAVVGVISKFAIGNESTTTWRIISICWLVISVAYPAFISICEYCFEPLMEQFYCFEYLDMALEWWFAHKFKAREYIDCIYCFISLGGWIAMLVMVAQQIIDFGDCTYFDTT